MIIGLTVDAENNIEDIYYFSASNFGENKAIANGCYARHIFSDIAPKLNGSFWHIAGVESLQSV